MDDPWKRKYVPSRPGAQWAAGQWRAVCTFVEDLRKASLPIPSLLLYRSFTLCSPGVGINFKYSECIVVLIHIIPLPAPSLDGKFG